MRIVSLLPSTTEILFAIGAGSDIVGVTFECDFPAEARERTIVSTSTLPAGMSPAEIDRHVSAALARGEDLYHLDRDALSGLEPDVIITQDLCAVCAVDVSVVDDALDFLGCRAEVVTIDPHTLDEVLDSITALGTVVGREQRAIELVRSLRSRMSGLVGCVSRPRVAVLEWTDPPFTPGHWVPEMVEAAGGLSVLGAAGRPSRRTTWEEVRAAEPELIVVAPCGFDRDESQRLADDLVVRGVLPPAADVLAVDANASWARPGPRLIDGIEELAAVLRSGRAPAAARTRMT